MNFNLNSFSTAIANKILGFSILAMTLLGANNVTAGPTMHVHDSAGNLATVDVETGEVSSIGNFGVVLTDIAFDPSGKLYGLSFTDLYSIDANTAAVTKIGSHSISGGNALVFGNDGILYGAGNQNTGIFTIDPGTGKATKLGDIDFTSGGDLAFHDDNLYLASGNSQLINIDLNDLTNTSAIGSFGVNNVYGLATGSDGNLYAVADTSIYTVDTTTGAATNGVSFGGQSLGSAFGQGFYTESGADENGNTPNVIPEPATFILFLLGLVSLGAIRRLVS